MMKLERVDSQSYASGDYPWQCRGCGLPRATNIQIDGSVWRFDVERGAELAPLQVSLAIPGITTY